MTIKTFLDISTAHVSPAARDHLIRIGSSTEGGWFTSAVIDDDTPNDLRAVFAYALSLGCQYVLFDMDADQIDQLPVLWED
jgi:hypothetical protein